MNVILGLLLAVFPLLAHSRTSLHKAKKYKCIEVEDKDEPTHYGWNRADEELKSIGKMSAGPPVQALTPKPYEAPATRPPHLPTNIPRDHAGRPLVLSPQHCDQVRKYAAQYGVRDVLPWVKSNCNFAKMFVPDATCEEINILVGSCYANKYL
ncbi:unnamed protein product, partial [Mesorhabditis spiculigera]